MWRNKTKPHGLFYPVIEKPEDENFRFNTGHASLGLSIKFS